MTDRPADLEFWDRIEDDDGEQIGGVAHPYLLERYMEIAGLTEDDLDE